MRVERARRDGPRATRDQRPETHSPWPNRIHDARLADGDGAGDGEDDVVVIGIIVEARNPRRVRRAGLGERRERDQDAKQQDDRPSAAHCTGPYARGPVGGGERLYVLNSDFFDKSLPRHAIQFATILLRWEPQNPPKVEAMRQFRENFDIEALRAMLGNS